ncbi:nucleolysin tia-1 [Phtheirospermum japonicum]|uniref:Nucleolysin tia-1 n=1 Tax=Phtheirospermum japonicum TaxID=374723 RepID=A0A830BNE4_9LAMI|nr:nucleolysin tia-1 [Phtheirospermum japonicum]
MLGCDYFEFCYARRKCCKRNRSVRWWVALERLRGETAQGMIVLANANHMAKHRKFLSAYGEIAKIRTMKDKQGDLKGFCFVRFARKESAARAVREISGTVIGGFILSMKFSDASPQPIPGMVSMPTDVKVSSLNTSGLESGACGEPYFAKKNL